MPDTAPASVRDLLLTRRGVAVLPAGAGTSHENEVRAVELELANIGYVFSIRLGERLMKCSLDELTTFRTWSMAALLAHVGADQRHEPLFRRFPDGIPDDTEELWWKKVLVHFLQADDQPCLFCRQSRTTHVLNPCRHVVCDQCFDGANYSACPVCEHHVDRTSPFFKPTAERGPSKKHVAFRLIDVAENEADEARRFFVNLCNRTQALSPDDRQALVVILRQCKGEALRWLPGQIPLRENIAVIFGTLFQELPPDTVLPLARRHMTTATDVLRFIAVLSGTDGSLLPETIIKPVRRESTAAHFWERVAKMLGAERAAQLVSVVHIPVRVYRFKVARLSRPLRRALLTIMESSDPERLVEDMLRHRSYWVWVGEFLHPHEFTARFPNVARAFQIVRQQSEDGTPAPEFRTWYSRLEQARQARDVPLLVTMLSERPGELARRLDLALRIAGDNAADVDLVIDALANRVSDLATPLLLTLGSLLPTRLQPAKVRVYWPKGRVAMGASSTDERAVLPGRAVHALVRIIHAELLRRFAEKPRFQHCLIDEQLRTVIVPFNERTATSSAASLPRGSRVPVALGKTARLFLHWRQPAGTTISTDLDLSVALYDAAWRYKEVCSYYQLKIANTKREIVAQSAGDLRDAPWPMGATEFVDLDCRRAAEMGVRYAVMVINAYTGLPFSQLERGFAGLMLRDDPAGSHFDPLTVKLKFALDGPNGVYMPMVLDLEEGVIHWLDVQAKGYLEMNNVESSKAAIAKVCPELMTYFASGVRSSMYDLALLHAAARCQRVALRGEGVQEFVRRPAESDIDFFDRLVCPSPAGRALARVSYDEPILAMLYQGDVDAPEGSCSYALFHERTAPTLAASDLLS